MQTGNPLFYLSTIRTDSIPIFVNNWTGVFPFSDEKTYLETLKKVQYTTDDLHYLFHHRFSLKGKKKEELFRLMTEKTSQINEWKKTPVPPPAIWCELDFLPADWKIFVLHCLYPDTWPYAHPYTLAAYAYLTGADLPALKRKRKEKFYLEVFCAYIHQAFYDIPLQKVNAALYAFGKYISESGTQKIHLS